MAELSREKHQLLLSIIKFLKKDSNEYSAERNESLEVAVQCLEAAFDIEYSRDCRHFDEIPDLATIFNIVMAGHNATALAEECKNRGNELVRNGMYPEALEYYNRAIILNPRNAVYYCNRAAAYSRLGNHDSAISDCEEAVRIDPKYAKAYGRMGIAFCSQNRFEEARDAYKQASLADPSNTMYEENMKLAEQRILSEPPESEVENPIDSAIDFGLFMNNPNLINMASQMLNDPGVCNVMSGLLNMGNQSEQPSVDTLMQMGQQLAQQMQANNPAFVDSLRRQLAGELSQENNLIEEIPSADEGDKKDDSSDPKSGKPGSDPKA